MLGVEQYETFMMHKYADAAYSSDYMDCIGRGHSTKVGQHSSSAHTKARKAKRRMSKKH